MFNLFLVLTSAILAGLSFNLPSFSFLIWFSLAPFLYILKSQKIKNGLIYSFLFSFFFFGTVFFWVTHVTVIGLTALLIYLSLYPILFFLLGRHFLNKPLAIITIPALWVLLELLKENIWCGLSWANLGYSQYKNFYLIQIADLFGAKFISFIIIAANVLVYELIFKLKSNAVIFKKIIFVLCAILICFAYSFFRLPTLRESDTIKVSLVQPGALQNVKLNASLRSAIIEKLKLLSEKTATPSLIIYPEAAWPGISEDGDLDELNNFAKSLDKDIVIGTVLFENRRFYNTVLLITKDSPVPDIYRKIKIVPFGEYVPLRKYLSFVNALNSIGDITRGKEYKVFSYKGKKFSVLICFEDIFPAFVSRFARNSDFLVNITDDSWFEGEPQASQHLGIMVFRAIENRISIARSANTGVSGWVSFRGEIHKLQNSGRTVFFEDVLDANLPLNNKRSLYNIWQELFSVFCGLTLIVSLINTQKSPAFRPGMNAD